VHRVFEAESLDDGVTSWFEDGLARHSASSMRHATRALRAPLLDAMARELPAVERLYLTELMRTRDANEGIQAFLEKRPPAWRDE
jgi:cyclohexa-1,5-dienecarbonyl-CoA hydratase